MRVLRAAAVVAGVAFGFGSIIVAQAQMADAITKRQEAMKGQGAAMRALTPMVRGEQPWNQQTAIQAAMNINESSKQIAALFPQGTGPDKGKTDALPVIWEKWADFQAAAKSLEASSGRALELARAGDEAGFKAHFPNVGRSCGGCHEPFRVKK